MPAAGPAPVRFLLSPLAGSVSVLMQMAVWLGRAGGQAFIDWRATRAQELQAHVSAGRPAGRPIVAQQRAPRTLLLLRCCCARGGHTTLNTPWLRASFCLRYPALLTADSAAIHGGQWGPHLLE